MRGVTAVADLHLQPVLALRSDATIADAARVLVETDARVALISTRPVGEVTEHDIATAFAEHVPANTMLRDFRFGPPCFARRDMTIDEVLELMLVTGRSALIVVDGDRPLGVARLTDALEARFGGATWMSAFRVALRIDGND